MGYGGTEALHFYLESIIIELIMTFQVSVTPVFSYWMFLCRKLVYNKFLAYADFLKGKSTQHIYK